MINILQLMLSNIHGIGVVLMDPDSEDESEYNSEDESEGIILYLQRDAIICEKFLGDVVLGTFNNVSWDEDNILDQIYIKEIVRTLIMRI